MTTCSLQGNVDQISTLSRTASFELFGADDGTVATTGNAPSEDIEIHVVSTIYSCPIVDAATAFPSAGLPTGEVVAPSPTDAGVPSASTQGSKATTTRLSTTANSPSAVGTSQSNGDRILVGLFQHFMIMLALAGTFVSFV